MRKSATASSYDERRQVELASRCDAKRLAARDEQRSSGAASASEASAGGLGEELLEVVEHDVRALGADAGCDRRWLAVSAPSASATAGSTSAASRSGASGTKTVPPSASSASSRASSIAKRVLPVPPGPTIVRMRGSSLEHDRTAS